MVGILKLHLHGLERNPCLIGGNDIESRRSIMLLLEFNCRPLDMSAESKDEEKKQLSGNDSGVEAKAALVWRVRRNFGTTNCMR